MSVSALQAGAQSGDSSAITLSRYPAEMINDTLEAERLCGVLSAVFLHENDMELTGEHVAGVRQVVHCILRCVERLQIDARELNEAHRVQVLGK